MSLPPDRQRRVRGLGPDASGAEGREQLKLRLAPMSVLFGATYPTREGGHLSAPFRSHCQAGNQAEGTTQSQTSGVSRFL